MDLAALKKEASSKKTSVAKLEQLARHSDATIQLAVAKNPNTSAVTLIYLSSHGNFAILKAIAKHHNAPDSVLEKLAGHKQYSVRQSVASNQNLSQLVIELLVKDLNEQVLHSLISRHIGKISIQTQESLAICNYPRIREYIFSYGNLSQTFKDKLLKDGLIEIGPKTLRFAGSELLDHFSDTSETTIREFIATLEQVSQQTLRKLSADESWEVRGEVAANANTPISVLENLAKDPLEEVRRRVASNPRLPSNILYFLADDSSQEVTYKVVFHESSTRDIFQKLTQSNWEKIRRLAKLRLEQMSKETL